MNHQMRVPEEADDHASDQADDQDGGASHARTQARSVNRAVGDLRRGVPVLLRGDADLVLLPLETATDRTLAEFLAAASEAPCILLAAGRARTLTGFSSGDVPVVAFRAPPSLSLPALRAVADPVLADSLRLEVLDGVPFGDEASRAALALAKLGRLLPAMLAAQARPGFRGDLLGVAAGDVLDYPELTASGLTRAAEASVPLAEAPDTCVVAFRPPDGGIEHLAIVIGKPREAALAGKAPLVRVHSECFTGDLLGSLRCDCGPQLHRAMRLMEQEGAGIVLYMAHEGRGIGLVNKLRAYRMQDSGLDTLDANRALGYGADERSFEEAAIMLRALGIGRVRLLTNNPDKVAALEVAGVEVTGRVGLAIAANGVNDFYLDTKARRFGHLLD